MCNNALEFIHTRVWEMLENESNEQNNSIIILQMCKLTNMS